MTAGLPKLRSETRAASAPCRCDRIALATGTRMHVTSSSSIHVSAGYCGIAIPHAGLRLIPPFRARLPEIAEARDLIAHAAIGSHEEHGCSAEHAP